MTIMTFQNKILIEHAVKYTIITIILAVIWNPVNTGLFNAVESGRLEALAVIMGIIALCSLTGYYTFSYTVVAKTWKQRYFGYLCTLLMGISLSVSLLIIYFIAVLWVPEMIFIWATVLGSLYIGTIIYDNFDLLRMGKDVAAINFFENNVNGSGSGSEDHILETTVDYLREGQRLPFSNALIGRAIAEIGQDAGIQRLVEGGSWISEQAEQEQHVIDQKIVELFRVFEKDVPKIKASLTELEQGQSQHAADNLIAGVIERISKHLDTQSK